MSVRTGFAIVGTAIGAYFGNAALGYSIGSMVGGYVDPIKNKGPRLTDAQAQTAQDGVPIPITYGGVRISGNIIASSTLVEHKSKDSGKGSGTETTTYTYTRTYAIGVCEGPIAAITRVWRDGKLVYDTHPAIGTNKATRVASAKWRANMDVYLGDEDQTPNSALQAIFGSDNVPAHRGLAYVVIRDDDLTDRAGSIPQLEFEVLNEVESIISTGDYGAYGYVNPVWTYPANAKIDPRNGFSYEYGVVPFGFGPDSPETNWYGSLDGALGQLGKGTEMRGWTEEFISVGDSGQGASQPYAPDRVVPEPLDSGRILLGLVFATDSYGEIRSHVDLNLVTYEDVGEGGMYIAQMRGDDDSANFGSGVLKKNPSEWTTEILNLPHGTFYKSPDVIVAVRALPSCTTYPDPTWAPIPGAPGFYVSPDGTIQEAGECATVDGDFKQLRTAVISPSGLTLLKKAVGPAAEAGGPDDTEAFWTDAYAIQSAAGFLPTGLVYGVDYPQSIDKACRCDFNTTDLPDYPLLSAIVADLCTRKGLEGTEIDVSQLTDVVKGFTVATATSAADAINALAPAYQFDEAEWDGRIRFIKRGGATEISLSDSDAFDSEDSRVVETRAQELELPRKMTLSYMDVAANYAVTTQTAERYSASVSASGTDQVALSVVMDADKAAQTADILLKDQWSSINGTLAISVGDEYSIVVPTDVMFLTYGEAVFRCRVVEVENADGVVKLSLQQDTAGAYSSTAVGVPPRPPVEGNPTFIGPTFAQVMNLPALRDQDDQVGLYLAACGPVGRWSGAQVAVSVDGGETWRDVLQLTQSATMGQSTSDLPIWSEHIPDTFHSFNVSLTSGDFESSTVDQMYAALTNPLCVGDEVLQFQTETLLSAGNYALGGVMFRGRKNTDSAPWPSATRVVSLSDVYFLPMDRSFIGRSLSFRFTSFGTDVQFGTIVTADFTVPKSVQEWPVTDIRHERASDEGLSLSWVPRHRLGTTRSPYPSSSFTGYRLVFTDGTSSRQFDTTAQSFAYSAAQQVADFGATGPLTVTLYATNSIIGPGEGATVTV